MAADRGDACVMASGSATLPQGNYSGVNTYGPFNVAGSLSQATASLHITQHSDPGITLAVSIEISLDNGVTWQVMGGFTRNGGPVPIDQYGNPINNAVMIVMQPHTTGGRRIRLTMTITGGVINTSGQFSWQ